MADFLGNSANAVRWQLWSALLCYVLLRYLAHLVAEPDREVHALELARGRAGIEEFLRTKNVHVSLR